MFHLIVISLFVILYYYATRNYNYWSDRKIPHNKPIPIFGNNFAHFMHRASRVQLATALYQQFPSVPVVGFYRGLTPELLIRDPDIIKHVLSVDFHHFYARGVGRDPNVEPMLKNAFHADGDVWKLLRQRLTPAFTSGKLKGMFPLIVECAEELQQLAEQICESGEPYDVRELMARFATDFIGACGFGIKMNSINDSSSQFRELGKNIFTLPSWKIFLKDFCPALFGSLRPTVQSVDDTIINIVKTIVDQRNYKPIGRNDFIDLLLELKSHGKIFAESIEKFKADGTPETAELEVDLMLMAAQCFLFFAAGFETSSSATSFTLHQLAHNPEVQATAQREVDRVLAKYDNKLCYDAVKEMTYLECTLKEGLRMFPSPGILNRMCTKRYQIPGTNYWIDKNVGITIPIAAIHNDEKYFKDPEEFDPCRFLPDASQERHKFVYLPFGEGPRACIGLRLGVMQSVAGLAALLQRFTVEPAPGGRRQVEVNPARGQVTQDIIGGLPLLLKKRVDPKY